MLLVRLIAALAFVPTLALALPGCGGDADEDAGTVAVETSEDAGDAMGDISVALAELSGSGQSGTATLTAENGEKVRVAITLDGKGRASHPAHIHEGSCDDLNPTPAYPLASVEEGSSETVLEGVGIEKLQDGDYALNVHESDSEPDEYIACGNLGSSD